MKSLTLALFTFLSVQAMAAETLVCALKDVKNQDNYSSIVIDLNKISDDYYIDEKGVNIGKENYSFNLQIERKGQNVNVSAVFTENKHVQDEVASSGWTANLKTAKRGVAVITEPLTNGHGKHVMDFVCYYNR